MPLSPAQKHQNRKKANKQYSAYIPLYIANSFDEKLAKSNTKFTEWLKEAMEKYLQKN